MKCSQVTCEEVASYSYVWPGKAERDYACANCLLKAKSVAGALGVPLGDVRVCTVEEFLATEK